MVKYVMASASGGGGHGGHGEGGGAADGHGGEAEAEGGHHGGHEGYQGRRRGPWPFTSQTKPQRGQTHFEYRANRQVSNRCNLASHANSASFPLAQAKFGQQQSNQINAQKLVVLLV